MVKVAPGRAGSIVLRERFLRLNTAASAASPRELHGSEAFWKWLRKRALAGKAKFWQALSLTDRRAVHRQGS